MENEQNTQPAAAPAETPMPALDIVLASASPRRKQLLEDAGVRFVVHASEVDETLEPDLLADPPEACKKLAERKAGAVVQEVLAEDYTGMAAVIGADTMVVCEGEIFGKPVSLSDAKRMLRCLSGRTHEVLTAVSVWMVAAPEPENISLGFRTFVDRSDVPRADRRRDRRLSAQGRVVRQGRRLCRAGGRSRSGGARRRRDGHRHRPARRSFAGGVPGLRGFGVLTDGERLDAGRLRRPISQSSRGLAHRNALRLRSPHDPARRNLPR